MKDIDCYFCGVIDHKDSVVIISRNYKGHPQLCYAPKILIVPIRIWNKYREDFIFDHSQTQLVFLDE